MIIFYNNTKGDFMANWLDRTKLLFGEDKINKLINSKVCIFGVGGVGGYVCEALARSGIGSITIVDNDVVSLTNINRQIIATTSTIGMHKVDVMEKRIKDINPNCNVEKYKCFFLPETKDQFDFRNYDYVIDCIDTVTGKIALVLKANEENTKIISSMGTGNKTNPQAFLVSDIYKTSIDPLARVMRTELKKRKIKKLKVVYSTEYPKKPILDSNIEIDSNKRQTPASNSFVPASAGLLIASEVIKDLIKD